MIPLEIGTCLSVLSQTVLLSDVMTKHASEKPCTVLPCTGGTVLAIAGHNAQKVCLIGQQEDSSLQ